MDGHVLEKGAGSMSWLTGEQIALYNSVKHYESDLIQCDLRGYLSTLLWSDIYASTKESFGNSIRVRYLV